ncbi:PI-PLC X domain-containing protein 3, partial [Ophiophagus hannah]
AIFTLPETRGKPLEPREGENAPPPGAGGQLGHTHHGHAYLATGQRTALPAMMQWVQAQTPGESGINIVTADFVELGDFISTIIKLNQGLDEGQELFPVTLEQGSPTLATLRPVNFNSQSWLRNSGS